MEFRNDPVTLSATITGTGDYNIKAVNWDGQAYPIITNGRQWVDDAGRHALVEASNGTRFELLLNRDTLSWQLRRVWRSQIA